MKGSDRCRSHADGPPPNAQGATPGNNNRKTHGLYSRYFHDDDIAALAAVAADAGLDDEIALTRVAIRRLAEHIENARGSDDAIALASALFNGAGRVAALLKAQRSLSGDVADGLAGAIGQALDELSNEWGIAI